ncbi:hypothetical protein AB0M80_22520 [Amycolatopsis sp. NPDC051045]|uniref:hypothetical protein n=1 Tax=Amycolatopsis sp. NPDC051045 TaxID=3156922 RepID=UPI003419143F
MPYSEALFRALAAWALVGVLERNWIMAGLVRPTAAALVLAVGLAALVAVIQRRDGWRLWVGGLLLHPQTCPPARPGCFRPTSKVVLRDADVRWVHRYPQCPGACAYRRSQLEDADSFRDASVPEASAVEIRLVDRILRVDTVVNVPAFDGIDGQKPDENRTVGEAGG